jgi:hypothetical protein
MSPLRKNLFVLSLILVSITPGAFSQKESSGGVNRGQNLLLFEIERNRDMDRIYYELALSDGQLNIQEPINIYWKKNTANNETQPLTRLQRNHSYGLKYLEIKHNFAKFRFAASKERDFVLKKNPNGDYRVYTQSGSGERELIKMYVHFARGTYLVPVIGHIELTLKDPKTDKIFTEAFEP